MLVSVRGREKGRGGAYFVVCVGILGWLLLGLCFDLGNETRVRLRWCGESSVAGVDVARKDWGRMVHLCFYHGTLYHGCCGRCTERRAVDKGCDSGHEIVSRPLVSPVHSIMSMGLRVALYMWPASGSLDDLPCVCSHIRGDRGRFHVWLVPRAEWRGQAVAPHDLNQYQKGDVARTRVMIYPRH